MRSSTRCCCAAMLIVCFVFEITRGALNRYEALQDAEFRAKKLPFCETCCLNIQETALDLLVETNPTGHVEANGFFSRFLLVQQKVQKRIGKRKNVTVCEAPREAAAASGSAAALPSDAKSIASAQLQNTLQPTSTRPKHADEGALERCIDSGEDGVSFSPSSPSAKLLQMHHRKEPSWSAMTQPGSNQVRFNDAARPSRQLWHAPHSR